MTSENDIAQRFARETTNHEMTVLHDDGLYRHIRFQKPQNGCGWFELITVPGVLIFRGDGEGFTFARLTDMFEFFRGRPGHINASYWAEKVTDGRERLQRYDEEIFKSYVTDYIADAKDSLPGLEDAVREQILESEEIGYDDEGWARRLVDDFSFYLNENDRYDYRKTPDFQFHDTWEWDLKDYHWWYLWACHAIVWGIRFYDTGKRPEMPVPATPTAPAETATPETIDGRPVVDVQLPEPVGSES
ncbi:hypothetical protein [Amycolatopsis pigmentata]|uniref:Uncharacterized protein n=1 Tax=Amycolatopsis pigmentata TaxID=450801 RepID=A0ABW5G400_9PSEU